MLKIGAVTKNRSIGWPRLRNHLPAILPRFMRSIANGNWCPREPMIRERIGTIRHSSMGKRSPTFLFLCATKKRSPNHFADMVIDIWRICGSKLQTDPGATCYCGGCQSALDTWTSCWECQGNLVNAFFDLCSMCNVARYCSRKCKVRAWKSGHKNKYAKSKISCDQFLERIQLFLPT